MTDADGYAAKIDSLTDEQFGPPPITVTEAELTRIALGRTPPPTQPEGDEFRTALRAFRDSRTITGTPKQRTYTIRGDAA